MEAFLSNSEKRDIVLSKSGIQYSQTIFEDVVWLLESDSITSIVGNEFKRSTNLVDDVNDYYQERYKGKIYRQGIGIIFLSRRSIQNSIAHGIGKNKRAAFSAVPEVLEKGRVFQIDSNHKGRGYESIIIAAPIMIWEKEFICEVAVNKKQGENATFYLHNVEIKEKLLSGTGPVRAYNGTSQMRKNTSKASKLIVSNIVLAVKNSSSNIMSMRSDEIAVSDA